MSIQDVIDATANPLRDHSARDIELAISKALSDLTGKPFITKLGKLDFSNTREGGLSSHDVFIELLVDEDRPCPLFDNKND